MTTAIQLLVLLLVAAPACSRGSSAVESPAAERPITGRLLGHDGRPMRLAHVRHGERTIAADPDGRFQITVPAARLTRLSFSGVDHAARSVPIAAGGEVELDVVLGTHPRSEPLTAVDLVIQQPGQDAAYITMQRRPDGTFAAEVERAGDELTYQVELPGARRTINGTQADRYSYDGGGDYASHVALRGRITIVFDPARLPPPDRPGRVEVRRGSRTQIELARIQDDIERPSAMSPPSIAQITNAAVAFAGELLPRLALERDPVVRGALMASYFITIGVGFEAPGTRPAATLAAQIAAEVPADSALWNLWPAVPLRAAMAAATVDARDYAERAAVAMPNPERAAAGLLRLVDLARHDGRRDDERRLAALLTARYGSTSAARQVNELALGHALQTGEPVPELDLPVFDEPGRRITSAALRGKHALIYFWGTWCGPCVHAMPKLHALHAELGDRLTIVTIAMYDSPSAVRQFRAKWSMPWLHAVLSAPPPSNAVVKAFGADLGVPRAALVDPSGTIVATPDQLIGDRLASTVSRALAAR